MRAVLTFYRYRPEFDVHEFDCGGQVDLETGLGRLEHLQRELDARPARDGVAKLLVDFRRTVWTSPDVHLQLARATRAWLDRLDRAAPGMLRVAYLHQQRAGVLSPSEAWFDEESQALHWLTRVER